MRIHLENNSMLLIDSVHYENNPLKEGGGFSAKVYLSEEEVQKLNQVPVLRIYLDDYDIPLQGPRRTSFFNVIHCLVNKE